MESYDSRANEWSAVAEMNHRRSGAAVADLGGRLYVVGGHDGMLVRYSVEYLDPRVGVWCGVADMQFSRRNACTSPRFVSVLSISHIGMGGGLDRMGQVFIAGRVQLH